MRTRVLISCAAALAACVFFLACDQRPADPALPTVDVELTSVRRFDGELRTVSLWASSSTDIYAGRTSIEVDGDVVFGGPPLIRHFDGSQWTDVDLPIEDEDGKPIIWGTSSDNVYVAVASLYHFDGNQWTKEIDDAHAVTGTSSSNVFAANYTGIFHFNGAEWDTLLTRPESRFDYSLFAAPDGSVWVVASDSILVWENSSWHAMSPSRPYYGNKIAPLSSTEALAIDPAGYYDADQETEVYRWRDGEWTEEAKIPAMLNALWAESPSSVYAVGNRGELWHFDGAEWTQLPRPTSFGLYAIAGLPSGGFVTAGDMGKVVSVDGPKRRTLREGLLGFGYYLSAWFESTTRYVAASDGVMFRQDRAEWSEIVPPFSSSVVAMGGTSIDDLFVSSPGGAMYRFDGTQWAMSDSLLGWQYSFWVADSGMMITAGNNSVYSYDGVWNILLEGDFSMVAVAADERGHILCAGRNIVKYYDGSAWKDLPVPSRAFLNDVWIGPEEDLFLADTGGMYRWSGSAFVRLTPPRSSDVLKIVGRDGQVLGFGFDSMVVYEAGIVSLQEARLYGPIVEGRDGNIYGTNGYGLSVWKQ